MYGGYPAQLGDGSGAPPPPPPSGTLGPFPTGGGPGGPGGGQSLVRNETFLRGGLQTNPFGVVELKMVYTGFYQVSSCGTRAGERMWLTMHPGPHAPYPHDGPHELEQVCQWVRFSLG